MGSIVSYNTEMDKSKWLDRFDKTYLATIFIILPTDPLMQPIYLISN